MFHHLKILPQYYNEVIRGIKTFEIRKNDRNYKVDDTVILYEFDGENFTGKRVGALITYITDYAQKENYIVFSIKLLGEGIWKA